MPLLATNMNGSISVWYALILVWVGLAASLCAFAGLGQNDWPQWRGPNRDGIAAGFSEPTRWPSVLRLLWRAQIGSGHSSPIVAGQRVYVHAREGIEEVVSCLALENGRTIWRRSYRAPAIGNQYAVHMGMGPNSTPVLHSGSLFTLGITGILSCFDSARGDLKWRRDFSRNVDTARTFTGTAMSPLAVDDVVIVQIGDDRLGRILALLADSGRERWSWNGDATSYSSPILVTLGGVRQIITLTDKLAVGIALGSGKCLWSIPYRDPENENIITPVLFENLLILSGIRYGTFAYRIDRIGSRWATNLAWQAPTVNMHIGSPVLDGHLLYGFSYKRKGQFFCLDLHDGKIQWMTEGRKGENASVVGAGQVLIFLSSDARMSIARQDPHKFEPLAQYEVADSPTWAHPVVLSTQVLIRDAAALSMWRFGE
jgi:outer membrane protein assembly factor BamB